MAGKTIVYDRYRISLGRQRISLGRPRISLNMQRIYKGWQIICSRIHYEWRNNDITGPIARQMSSGKIRLVREQICVTPGYTLVRHRPPGSIDFPAWPRTGHNLIVMEWPECSKDPRNETSYNCWKKLFRVV